MLLLEVSSFLLGALERFEIMINNNFLKESLVLRIVVVHHSGFCTLNGKQSQKEVTYTLKHVA
jgi:hypothetical protein